jgi:hypothetical protein
MVSGLAKLTTNHGRNVDPAIVEAWLRDTRQLLAITASPERIINCDETSWKKYLDNLVTWPVRGAHHVLRAINGRAKAAFTALSSITATRTNLRMVLIASGKTQRVERHPLVDIEPHGRWYPVAKRILCS